ncbi:uncharacterized protein LOC134805430 [Cydia splendana]|uniref:uncharacterized protein LOC134805430 n=1 Tax=Cydia splendana TaxID=1100963 RepID=UPI00300D4A6F
MPVHPHLDILQCNVNHSARAQDLLMQFTAEWGISIAVVAEPYFVPPQSNWVGATDGRVAMMVPAVGDFPLLTPIARGRGYAAEKWGETVVVASYFSPNKPLRDLEQFLEEIGNIVRRASPSQVLVLGDFNAKSEAWGSPLTNPKGAALRDWAVATGLAVLNQGNANTCVRRQGGSIVDISFATPAIAARITNWRVLEEVETLSDHLYIQMRVHNAPVVPPMPGRNGFPKWTITKLDREMADEAAMVEAWNNPPPIALGVDERASRLRESLQN